MHLTSFVLMVFIFLALLGLAVPDSASGQSSTGPDSVDKTRTGGTLIVLNKAEASVSLLSRDAASGGGEAFATIAVGDGPHEVAVSPDGKTAVVCNYGQRIPGNTLSVIDLTSQKVTKTIELGEYRRPHGIMYLSDGNHIVVTSEVAKKLLLIDIDKGKVVYAIHTDAEISHMVVVSPDETRAFVANLGSSSITAIDLDEKKLLAVIPTGEGAEGMDISPDGKEVWVGNRAANNVTIVDAKTLKVVHTMECGTFPIRCKFTPDGKYVLVSNGSSGDVAIFDVAQRKEIKRLSMGETAVEGHEERLFSDRFGESPVPVGIMIPPDGRHAYVANTNADIVTVIDLQTMEIVGRLTAGKEPDGLGWTPLEIRE